MTEILTESFCERCGTRYTFESAAPQRSRLGKVRTLSKGLRNFVLSDETTLSEAMADARSEEELAATATQLDAFHKAFNFCMSCRQYTCGSCWNEADGRCLTCAPHLDHEILPTPFAQTPDAAQANGYAAVPAFDDPAPDDATMWPEVDLDPERVARVMGTAPATSDQPQAGTPGIDREQEAPAHIRGLEPGQSLDEAIAAYEASLEDESAAMPAEMEPSAVEVEVDEAPFSADAGAAPEPEIAAQGAELPSQPGPDAAALEATASAEPEFPTAEATEVEVEVEAASEPIAAEAAAEAAPDPNAEPVASQADPGRLDDVIPQPLWLVTPPAAEAPLPAPPITTTELTETPASPWLAVAPETPDAAPDSSAPDWPATPQWPAAQPWATPRTGRPEAPRTLAGRPLLPAEPSGLWAASSAEVLAQPVAAQAAPPTAQPCVSCGLSLSANARFCRRCGTRQG